MGQHLISLMVLFPLVGAVLQALLPYGQADQGATTGEKPGWFALSPWIALIASLASSICGAVLVLSMRTQTSELQAVESFPWVGSFAISYDMGIDGLSALPVLLIVIIFPLLVASEWGQRSGLRGMQALLLSLQASFAGAVCAQDLFLMFFFWSLTALPLYFLVGIWGGAERETAANRAIVSAAIGNALFFAALILIYYSVDPHTFSLRELALSGLRDKTFRMFGTSLPVAEVAFGLVGAGLALRAPIWPVHGWFTKTAQEAPASVFVACSAVSVPVAIYVFIRLSYSLFPETITAVSQGVVIVGAINLIFGGLCAVAQRSLKSLLAFICVSEVGLVLIGIGSLNAPGVVGAVYQLLGMGLGLAAFGLFAGVVIQRAPGGVGEFVDAQGKSAFGGLAMKAPLMALVAAVAASSLLGMPGFGGFVGQALLMIGSYAVHPSVLLLASGAALLATYYLFTMYRHVFLGKVGDQATRMPDLTARERAYLFPLVACIVVFGVYSKPWLELVRPTVLTLLSTIK